MSDVAKYIAIALLGLLAVGCHSTRDFSSIPSLSPAPILSDDETISSEDGATEPTIELASLEVPSEEDAASLLPEGGPVRLRLEDAIAWSLERNPDLAIARAAEPVALAAFHVAGTRMYNPQFQTQLAPYSRDLSGADGSVAQQHVLVQTFELAGQRGYRTGAAAADHQRVQWTIRQAELSNMAQTERLYATAMYRRDLRDLAASLAELNDQMVGVVQRRFTAGEANRGDLTLTRLQAESARRQQRLAEAACQTALADLRVQLNLGAQDAIELADDWSRWQWQPVDDAGLPQRLGERPDIVAARAAVSGAEANVALAQAARTPDLQIGPMWERDDAATEFWGIQAQMDLPVVNTGKPLVRQRQAELCQAQTQSCSLEEKSLQQASAAVQRYERARRLVEQSQAELSVGLEDVLQPVEDQFKAGQITLLEVFAARTVLAESRRSLLDLLNELAQAAADVTEATGLPPQELLITDAEPDLQGGEQEEASEETESP